MENYTKVYLYRRIVQAKLFIDNNYSKKINTNNISDTAYFSKFHFIRLFKEIYGKTPHQYLTYVRIKNAVNLLNEGKNVSEVCFSVGFESLSSFSVLFKKFIGQSPRTYLKEKSIRNLRAKENPLAFIPSCYAYQNGWI